MAYAGAMVNMTFAGIALLVTAAALVRVRRSIVCGRERTISRVNGGELPPPPQCMECLCIICPCVRPSWALEVDATPRLTRTVAATTKFTIFAMDVIAHAVLCGRSGHALGIVRVGVRVG